MELLNYCTSDETEKIIRQETNPKHQAQILLMVDAGLRPTEVCNLKWSDCDFRKKVLKIRSLKKRDADAEPRKIPMSNRIYASFEAYVEKKGKQDGFVFANPQGEPPTRQSVNNLLRKIEAQNPEIDRLHPYKLRHTFATNLRAQGAKLEDIRDMLGHEKLETSLIYAHTDVEELRAKIEASQPKKSWFVRLKERFAARERPRVNLITADPRLLIGRSDEVRQIEKLLSKDISVLLTGPVGVGKSHIVNNLNFGKPVLEIDDCKDFKKSVANILLHLFDGDKEQAAELIFNSSNKSTLQTKVSKESLINLCSLLKQVTTRHEYILKINDLDNLTPSVGKALEVLKEHFVILSTARIVKTDVATCVSDFERIHIKPLKREDSLKLFHRLTDGYQVENLEYVRNKVYDTSEGNPRAIVELSERFGKEPVISAGIVEEICNGYLGRQIKEIDMSVYLLMIFGGLTVLKYIGRETGDDSLKFVGSFMMIIGLFARYFFNRVRRKSL